MDDVAGSKTIGGDEDFGMEAGPEEIDGHHGCAGKAPLGVKSLTEQHPASLQRGMCVTADCMANHLSEKHGVR